MTWHDDINQMESEDRAASRFWEAHPSSTDYCSRCGHDLALSSYWRGCHVEGCGCGLYAPTNPRQACGRADTDE